MLAAVLAAVMFFWSLFSSLFCCLVQFCSFLNERYDVSSWDEIAAFETATAFLTRDMAKQISQGHDFFKLVNRFLPIVLPKWKSITKNNLPMMHSADPLTKV